MGSQAHLWGRSGESVSHDFSCFLHDLDPLAVHPYFRIGVGPGGPGPLVDFVAEVADAPRLVAETAVGLDDGDRDVGPLRALGLAAPLEDLSEPCG